MIDLYAHFETGTTPFSVEVGEERGEAGYEYNNFNLGHFLNIMATTEQLETIFDALDKRLHPGKTYSDLQDQIFSIQDDLDNSNDEVGRMEDIVQENLA